MYIVMYNEDGVVQEIIKEHELGHPGETKPSEIAMVRWCWQNLETGIWAD